jgi:GH43 family beta-xylosidase
MKTALIFVVILWTSTFSQTFTNPIQGGNAPDPHVTYHDGYYYGTYTTGGNIRIWKSPTLHNVFQGVSESVWSGRDLWAPEIHLINGKWYIYSTTHPGNYWFSTIVLEANTSNPQGSYTLKGTLSSLSNTIDASPWQDPATGQLYLSYSKMDGASGQEIWLTKMSNPYTVDGTPVKLSGPDYPWEQEYGNVNEGPQFLVKGSKIHIVYSASQCHYEGYKLGLLSANSGSDLMNPSSWSKSPYSVFQKSPAHNAYAVGHHSTIQTPNGEWWLMYHGKYDHNKNTVNSPRDARLQPFTWNGDIPDFGEPVATGTPIEIPGTLNQSSSSSVNSSSSSAPVNAVPPHFWNFDVDLEGWYGLHHLNGSVQSGLLQLEVTGNDPYLHSPDHLSVATDTLDRVIIRMKNQTTATMAQLYWITNSESSYGSNKSLSFPIHANDSVHNDYIIDLSSHSQWAGTLRQIRLDPVSGTDAGTISVNFIKVVGLAGASPQILPGVLQLENTLWGGEGASWHDTDAGNSGGAYRTHVDVDIQAIPGGGYSVGWVNTGEWLEYSIAVANTGTYQWNFWAASVLGNDSVALQIDGVEMARFGFAATEGLHDYQARSALFAIPEGEHVLRVAVIKSGGGFNMDRMEVLLIEDPVAIPLKPSIPKTTKIESKKYDLKGRRL